MTTAESNSQDQNKSAIPQTTTTTDAKDHEIQVLQERIEELEELVKKSMETNPALGFQTATAMVDQEIANQTSNELATKQQPISNEMSTRKQPGPGMEALISATGIVPNEIIFPSNLLGKFFIASRNVKNHVKLRLNGTTVESWEIG